MWHVNERRPKAAKFSQYHGARLSAGGMMVEEIVAEESTYEMCYEHRNWADHSTVMNGYPRAKWVSKAL